MQTTSRPFKIRVGSGKLEPPPFLEGGRFGDPWEIKLEDFADQPNINPMSESIIDAKIGQAKAEVDTEFAKLRGDLGLLTAKVDRLPGLWAMIATVATAGAAIVGVLLAVMAFGGDRFDSGMSASGIVAQVRDEQRVVDARQDAQFTEMGGKLDAILARLPGDDGSTADTGAKAN